jgi:C-terminal processing protease CtpA/Prc
VTSAKSFAKKLTEDLQEVSKDKHLRVRYSHEPVPVDNEEPREPNAQERQEELRESTWMNHAFNKVERLRGNIGYIEFWGFFNPEFGAETVAAAMNFVSGTDALIIDLRNNGGGSPEMVALVCSYLFGPEPVHLNDLYWREGNKTQEFWTRKEVSGKRYLNFRLHEHFRMFVPTGRAINPITKTNWEGTGVKPDVEVPAKQALIVARLMALKKSLPTLTRPDFKDGVQEEIEKLEKELGELKAIK